MVRKLFLQTVFVDVMRGRHAFTRISRSGNSNDTDWTKFDFARISLAPLSRQDDVRVPRYGFATSDPKVEVSPGFAASRKFASIRR